MHGQQGELGQSPHLLQALVSVSHCCAWRPCGVCCVSRHWRLLRGGGRQVCLLAGGLGDVPYTCHALAACLLTWGFPSADGRVGGDLTTTQRGSGVLFTYQQHGCMETVEELGCRLL
jgi:hypothetical protein